MTHGAIDAEEHAHFHPYGSPGARFSPASWLSLCEDGAPENCQCFFCSRSRLPLRFKASRVQQSGADSERYASPEPTQDASGRTKLSCKGRCRRSSNTSIPYADLDLQSIQKRTSTGKTHHIMVADVDSCKEGVDSCLRRCPHADDGVLATRMLTCMPI